MGMRICNHPEWLKLRKIWDKEKDKIWELGGTLNYANCRDGLKEYHLKHLGYEKYQYQAHVPGGNIGGSGTVEDKKYFIIHESAPNPFF